MKKEVEIDINVLPEWQRSRNWAKLQAWFNAALGNTSDTMIYKKAFEKQVIFVRDTINYLIKPKSIDVISEHISKSIHLPVYKLEFDNGMTIIMRDNFYDWKVSVNSPIDLSLPESLFGNGVEEKIHSCYCEGFDESWVYTSYRENKRQFTVEIPSDEMLFTFFFNLKEQLAIKDGVDSNTFTHESIDNLRITCEKIIGILNENENGNFIYSQLVALGESLKQFKENPIVKTSGIIK